MAQIGDKRPNPSIDEADPRGVGPGKKENVTKRPRGDPEPWSKMSLEDIPEPPVYRLDRTSCFMLNRKDEDIVWCLDQLVNTQYGVFRLHTWCREHSEQDQQEDCGGSGRVHEYRPVSAFVRLAAEKRARRKRDKLSSSRPGQDDATTDAHSCREGRSEAKDGDPSPGPSHARQAIHGHARVDEAYRALLSAMDATNRLIQPARMGVTDPTSGGTTQPLRTLWESAAQALPEGSPTAAAPARDQQDLLVAAIASLHHLSTACSDLIGDFQGCTKERSKLQALLDVKCKEVDTLRKNFQREAFMREEATQNLLGLMEGLRFDIYSKDHVGCQLVTAARRTNFYFTRDDEY